MARRELAASGYGEQRDFPEVVIKFNNEANHGLIAQTIASMLRTNLGIRVEELQFVHQENSRNGSLEVRRFGNRRSLNLTVPLIPART